MSASRTRGVQEKRLNHLQPAAQSRSSRVPLHVVMVAFPGAALLDVTGPISIFTSAARGLQERKDASVIAYTCEIVAPEKGPLQTAGGVQIVADRSFHQLRGSIDTLLVAGGPTVEVVVQNRELIAWLRRIAPRVRRLGSVCTGSFLLAEAGLLDGRRATTHWASGATFAQRYPQVTLDLDPIFVRDGNIYTSAGVTTGMDLALALVEEDYGHAIASYVARALVLFLRRPGGQSQFSALLEAEAAHPTPLRELLTWVAEHPSANLSVPALAKRVAMSPRNFARVFTREIGTTPGRFIERVRVEAARRRLEESTCSLEQIADSCGFGCTESLRRAFLHTLRVSPVAYRHRFRATGSAYTTGGRE